MTPYVRNNGFLTLLNKDLDGRCMMSKLGIYENKENQGIGVEEK